MGGSIMSVLDKIIKFRAYAMAHNTTLYNEDSITAQQLNIRTADKIAECLQTVNDLAIAIENIKAYLKITYNEDAEELELTFGKKIEEIKTQVNNSYVCLFDENSMTALELAGNTARAVNECLKAVNMLCDLVVDLNDTIALNYSPEDSMLTL